MFSNTSSKYVITRSHAINLLPLQTKSTSIACPVTKKLNCIYTSLLSTGIMSMEGAGETLKKNEFLWRMNFSFSASLSGLCHTCRFCSILTQSIHDFCSTRFLVARVQRTFLVLETWNLPKKYLPRVFLSSLASLLRQTASWS